jgi:4-amino-4-deoxy-L-arabinose transferase-like glycosyltransferase
MSHWIMGLFVGLLGLVGLFMASAARDFGILAFGLGLALFAVLFCWWMIKIAFDEGERHDA